jgi:murein L,D-transpeptidase YcbB/YkuD
MNKPTRPDTLSRRRFIGRAAALAATTVVTGPALAQTAIEDIINSPRRGSWDDQFDAKSSRSVAATATRHPISSADTIGFVERAIFDYQDIVARGGWPVVPATKKLRMGVSEPEVRLLRQRLIASGDLSATPACPMPSIPMSTVRSRSSRRVMACRRMASWATIPTRLSMCPPMSASASLRPTSCGLRSMSGFLGDRYVMVNIPAAQIEAVENGRVVLRHTAIVGKIDRQTPILNSKIHEIILNPYWTSPRSIIEKDIVPLMRKDPTYLTRNSIRLFDGKGNEVAPETIDWHAEKAPDLMFRQDPGKGNAMSSTKINFHNPHAVYMHDTPQQGVFNQLMRFESSGCVRVQNVRDLNTWLLRDTPGWNRQAIEATIASGENTEIAALRAGACLFHLFHRLGVRGRRRAVPRRCLPARRCG